MAASTRAELVDEIVDSILGRLRDVFPLREQIDLNGIAADCDIAFSTKTNGAGRTETEGDDVFGGSFIRLAKATAFWLHSEGYLIAIGDDDWPYYALSERGARLVRCLPPTLDVE